mmetsp:Transcript_4280/g.7495  ORF Transcript_4280/g.7495 Transcript_4280/m.7495 type:complete len:147 (+) Transcript_4280:77-517(+)
MSGITCEDECITAFNKFKLQNSTPGANIHKFLIFRIDKSEKIKLVERGNKSSSWSEFVEALSKDDKDGAYGLFDMHAEGPDGRLLDKVIFVAWSPDTLPVKAKMLYGSSREGFKSALGSGIAYTIQATDISDLEEDDVTAMVVKGR